MTKGTLLRASQRLRYRKQACAFCNFLGLTMALLIYALLGMQTATALELRCADTSVVVQSSNLQDAILICEGATDATKMLGQYKFVTNVRIEFSVVDELPTIFNAVAFGGYNGAEGRAYLLPSSAIADRGSVFDLPFEQALYRSLATHEVAHAITNYNYRTSAPTTEAHEYIAYAVMFATMPEEYRDRLLVRFANQQFDDEAQINSFVYLVDPLRFGVLAYKHFTKLEDKTGFLQRVLRGRELAARTDLPY